jgi:CHRD domain
MRRVRQLAAGAAISVAMVAAGDATSVGADTTRFVATGTVLTGANEVPGPGDPDGVGAAGVVIDRQGRICYFVAVKRIAPATMAHIHVGAPDVAGPVVVGLRPPTNGFSAACVGVDQTLANAIADNPAGYYVNVHNAEFPAGAIRGQLL